MVHRKLLPTLWQDFPTGSSVLHWLLRFIGLVLYCLAVRYFGFIGLAVWCFIGLAVWYFGTLVLWCFLLLLQKPTSLKYELWCFPALVLCIALVIAAHPHQYT